MAGIPWTQKQLAFLTANHAAMSARDIAVAVSRIGPKRSPGSVNKKIDSMGLAKPRSVAHRSWSRAELDRLEAMIKQGAIYQEIADALGRSRTSVRGKAYEMRMTNAKRMGAHKRKDPALAAKLHDMIADCIDFRGMTCAGATRHLNALGYDVSNAWVQKQIGKMGAQYRAWARQNASRRRALAMSRMRRAQEKAKAEERRARA